MSENNLTYILSGDVLTKEQSDILYGLAKDIDKYADNINIIAVKNEIERIKKYFEEENSK